MFWAEIGAKQPNTVKIVWWHRLVRSDTVILADCDLDRTVPGNYGWYRVITVENPTLRRKCTGLISIMFRISRKLYLVVLLPKLQYIHNYVQP
jgi:hypothetical protein